jgi:hypothetical protein
MVAPENASVTNRDLVIELPKGQVVNGILERNQSPCVLMKFEEGRHSLVLAST